MHGGDLMVSQMIRWRRTMTPTEQPTGIGLEPSVESKTVKSKAGTRRVRVTSGRSSHPARGESCRRTVAESWSPADRMASSCRKPRLGPNDPVWIGRIQLEGPDRCRRIGLPRPGLQPRCVLWPVTCESHSAKGVMIMFLRGRIVIESFISGSGSPR